MRIGRSSVSAEQTTAIGRAGEVGAARTIRPILRSDDVFVAAPEGRRDQMTMRQSEQVKGDGGDEQHVSVPVPGDGVRRSQRALSRGEQLLQPATDPAGVGGGSDAGPDV